MAIIKDIIQEFFKSMYDILHDEINRYMDEFLKKSTRKLFSTGITVSIISIGLFLLFWGIASYIDMIFKMTGLGFILIGIIVTLIGMLSYQMTLKN